MRAYINMQAVKLGKIGKKLNKEVKKLAVAVVIAEILLVIGYAIGEQYDLFQVFRQEAKIEIVNAKRIEPQKADVQEDRIGYLADYIWMKESTRGKNNYSKCEAIGKINDIGYGIDGTGKYICFENHENEMQVLKGWIIAKLAQGYTERDLLCLYSGGNYSECKQ